MVIGLVTMFSSTAIFALGRSYTVLFLARSLQVSFLIDDEEQKEKKVLFFPIDQVWRESGIKRAPGKGSFSALHQMSTASPGSRFGRR